MSLRLSTRLLATQSDERLQALVREGHERAFEALVLRYRRPLLGYCRRLGLSEARAEDALQLALLKSWIALREGAEVSQLKGWLYRIAHNTALNALRAGERAGEQPTDPALLGAQSHPDLDRGLLAREALAQVGALPALQREALVRTALAGHSHERAAGDLGVSPGALRGLVYRARATLRTAVSALTPAPALQWLAGATDGSTPTAERLVGIVTGGGAAGAGGLLLKGGTVALTAGALITGVVVHAHGHRAARSPGARAQAATSAERPRRAGAGVTAAWIPAGPTGAGSGHRSAQVAPGGLAGAATGAARRGRLLAPNRSAPRSGFAPRTGAGGGSGAASRRGPGRGAGLRAGSATAPGAAAPGWAGSPAEGHDGSSRDGEAGASPAASRSPSEVPSPPATGASATAASSSSDGGGSSGAQADGHDESGGRTGPGGGADTGAPSGGGSASAEEATTGSGATDDGAERDGAVRCDSASPCGSPSQPTSGPASPSG